MVLRSTLLFIFCLFMILSQRAEGEELLLGFYALPDKSLIDLIANSPFNFLMPYGTDGQEDYFLDDYLDYALKKNIKIIFSLKDSFRWSKWYPKINWCPTNEESKLISCIVKKYDSHPAVYGWYLADEPTDFGMRKMSKVGQNALTIKKYSSKHIFAYDYPLPKGKLWDDMSVFSSALMTGAYPVPEGRLSEIYDAVKGLASSYNKPVIAVVQTHGKYQYPFYDRDEITGRPPTYAEIRAMSYISLIAGAKGIMFYSLFDINKLPDFEERLKMLKNLGKEIQNYYPVIRSSLRPSMNYYVKKDHGVYHVIKHYSDKDIIVAINAEKTKKILTIFTKSDEKIIILEPLALKIMRIEEIN